jgi:hypothetical protein
MTKPFGRQAKPTIITITGGDDIDRQQMAADLHRYLTGRIDLVERSGNPNAQIIRCYPRAVND